VESAVIGALAGAAGLVAGAAIGYALARRSRASIPAPPAPEPALRPGTSTIRRGELLADLAAGVAHELGQPLSAARVSIEGVHYLRQLGREPTPEHLEKTLARVGMSLLAMTQTIEHLRSLARQDGPCQPAGIDLRDLVEAVLAERDQWLRFRETRIEWQRPGVPVRVLADPAGVRLILVNLLRNAVEAVEGQSDERRLVRVTAGPGPVLAVHDSGPGVPADMLPRLFDPFASSKGPGRGIGLSLASASARRMGGQLEASSQAGAGTRFTLMLPGAEAP
jgi:two-component system C4-dicarboxylate transport sensor histidine kinase DctB